MNRAHEIPTCTPLWAAVCDFAVRDSNNGEGSYVGRSGQKCPEGAKFPPFGGASIASGYTPDALAGAKPQHPPAPKGEKGV